MWNDVKTFQEKLYFSFCHNDSCKILQVSLNIHTITPSGWTLNSDWSVHRFWWLSMRIIFSHAIDRKLEKQVMLRSIVLRFRHLVCLSGSWPRFLHSDSLSSYPEGGSIFVVLHSDWFKVFGEEGGLTNFDNFLMALHMFYRAILRDFFQK